MANKLSRIPPLLSSVPPALGSAPDSPLKMERQRNLLNPLRALYRTAQWKALRMRVLTRDMFTCQMCGKLEGDTSQLVADHRKPHRGDLDLFWDENNVETLCASPCHSKHKQRLEQDAAMR